MSDSQQEQPTQEKDVTQEEAQKEEVQKEEAEQPESKKEETQEETKKEEIKKEEVQEENKKEEESNNEPKQEEDKGKEMSVFEEDKKELYDAIKDLKPENANDNIKSKLLTLADIHLEYKKVENDDYGQEYDSLQDKYDKQYLQIYDKIEEIVKSKEKIDISPEEAEKYGITEEGENHEIEDYWQKVILNSRYFTITDKDKTILKYIKKVNYYKFPDSANNFRVDFIFQENEFFIPEVLSKTYEYDKDGVLKKAIGTEIHWKSKDKNPTIEKVKKKIKKGKKVFYENKEEKVDSFFSFFSQTDDMTFLSDEVTFFKEDLFVNQLEYYLDIVSKTKNGGLEDEDLDDEDDDGHAENRGGQGSGDGKKEECKQQ
jgi:hypothetical protein